MCMGTLLVITGSELSEYNPWHSQTVSIGAVVRQNPTALAEVFSCINHKGDLNAKSAFVHWNVGEGMDEGGSLKAWEDSTTLEQAYEDIGIETAGGEDAAKGYGSSETSSSSCVTHVCQERCLDCTDREKKVQRKQPWS